MPTDDIRPFDYATVADRDDRRWLREQVQGIAAALDRAASGVLEAGERLHAVKMRLGHGRFKRWVETEFPGAYQTAWRRMAAWRASRKIPCHGIFPPEILVYLVGASIPQKARAVIVEKVQAGERLEMAQVREIVSAFRPPPKSRVRALARELESEPEPQRAGPASPLDWLASALQRGQVSIARNEGDDGQEWFRVSVAGPARDLPAREGEGVTLEEAIRRVCDPGGEVLRVCTGECATAKPLAAFSRKRNGPGGRNYACKVCESRRASAGKKRKRG